MKSILSDVEIDVFTSMSAGSSNKQIADNYDMQDSYVRKVKTRIRKKLAKELSQVANTLRLQFTDSDINKEQGLLKSFDWVNNTWVILVFTPNSGIIAYYDHECSDNCQKTCEKTLDDIINERALQIDEKFNSLSTRLRFDHVFETIRKIGA
jgi:hypothetical protein